ncbi:MAG: nuclear transport factor 2 family protein [Bacteroidales bacterium]|nr:nuclear transport factor 2 family protein [Bacteroidales bacterium]
MKTNIFTIVSLLFALTIAISCASPKPSDNNEEPTNTEVQPTETTDFAALVKEWNKANSAKDYEALSAMFDNNVLFYGTQLNKDACVENKRMAFKKSPDFYQQIYGYVDVEKISDTEVKCSFVKRVTVSGQTNDYPSYLNFHKVGDEWKISAESDLITDENLAKRAENKKNALAQEMGDRTDVSGTYDFNGDGKKESCYLLEPKKYDDEDHFMECQGECNCLIMFSDSNIPPIEVENCIGGNPHILGDLDGNGTCEIGIWPWWWTSCWHTFYIYTLENGEWKDFVEPFSVHCNLLEALEESGEPIITPLKGQKGMFNIRYSYFDDEDGIMEGTTTVKKL